LIPPEELADAPDYKWRRWWAKAGIPSTIVIFMFFFAVTNIVIALIAAGAFYYFVGRKVLELDALARGYDSPDLDDIIAAALKRKQDHEREQGEPTASGIPRVAAPGSEPSPEPPSPPRRPVASFGKAKVPGKKPVDLPRHRS